MEKHIVQFIHILKRAGIRISVSETLDALNAVNIVGVDKNVFKDALSATLIKEKKDLPSFSKLFDLFFLNHPHNGYNGSDYPSTEMPTGGAAKTDGRGLASTGAGGPAPSLYAALANKEKGAVLDYFKERIGEIDFNDLSSLTDFDKIIKETMISLDWYMLLHQLEKEFKENTLILKEYLEKLQLLDAIKEDMFTLLEKKAIESFGMVALTTLAEKENIYNTDFQALQHKQIQELELRIIQLGRRLSTKKAYRYTPANKGRINLRRTVRKSIAYAGVPIAFSLEKRRIKRPQLLILCDVSASVSQFSRFMLQFVYHTQRLFTDISLFIFIDHLADVTQLFKNYDLETIFEELPYLKQITETGFSHFGQVFKEFHLGYLPLVTEKTTVLILGDAKNNWRFSGIEYLEMIKNRCHRLYWLNPQPKQTWNNRDSIIDIYRPICTEVFECRNMAQLEDVVNKIF